MNTFITTILVTVGIYFLALFLTRIIGKKIISQMNFFDFIVAVTFGSIVANIAIGPVEDIAKRVTAFVSLAVVVILLDVLHIKSFRIRKLITSEPLALISKGKIVDQNMKRSRMSINELMAMLRQNNAFSINDVEFAILEDDGQLSVQKRPDKEPLTPGDMNMKKSSKGLTKDIIIDGNLMEENLKSSRHDIAWLNQQLLSQGIHEVSQVFYAGVDDSGILYVSRKSNNTKEEHGKYGIE